MIVFRGILEEMTEWRNLMDRRVLIIIAVAVVAVAVPVLAVEVFDEAIFSQIPYSYTSYTSIPSNKAGEASLGGYYSINGTGRDFNFSIVLPGAENFDTHEVNGTRICYNESGLSGTGHIDHIDVTWETIYLLLRGDLKSAMFSTPLRGHYRMTCAAWDGGGNFSNDGRTFKGDFRINGVETFFGGNFTLRSENGRIVLSADYIHHPQGKPWEARRVKKDFYM